MKINDKVEIINSHISGVNVGDKGEIVCEKDKGYGVKITKVWPVIVSQDIEKIAKPRVLYFEPKQLRVIK